MKTAREEMTRRVAFVVEEDDLSKAHSSMTTLEMHHVPVLRQGRVVGILSDRDILLHAHERHGEVVVPTKRVGDVMSSRVIVCSASTTIGRCADLMLEHRIHCLPVVDDHERLLGIVTSSDLLRLLRESGWGVEEKIPFRFDRPTILSEMVQ